MRAGITARRLQVALGCLWIFDGLLQLGPSNFSPDFFGTMLRMNMAEPPGWLWDLGSRIEPFTVSHAALVNGFAGGFQLAIGLGLVFRGTVRPALAVSIPWALSVWLFGESAGGLFSPGASALVGAPGAALLYAVVALVLWPRDEDRARVAPATRDALGELAWAALWVGTAALEAGALNRLPTTAGTEIWSGGGAGPGPLTGLDHAVGSLVGPHGVAFAVVAGVAQVLIGLGVLARPTRRAALAAGMVVAVFYGLVGQDLGHIFSNGWSGVLTSGATDPGTAPIVVLLGLALWTRLVDRHAVTQGALGRELPTGMLDVADAERARLSA